MKKRHRAGKKYFHGDDLTKKALDRKRKSKTEPWEKKARNRGFTLIELLIVIGIIGILAAVVLVNLNNSRSSSRDAKRISDIHQISTALQLFFQDNSGYPLPNVASATGPTPADGSPAWSTYMATWPVAPVPPDNPTGSSACDAGTNQYSYRQRNGGGEYNVTFCLGSPIGNYGAGVHTLSSTGIQ